MFRTLNGANYYRVNESPKTMTKTLPTGIKIRTKGARIIVSNPDTENRSITYKYLMKCVNNQASTEA